MTTNSPRRQYVPKASYRLPKDEQNRSKQSARRQQNSAKAFREHVLHKRSRQQEVEQNVVAGNALRAVRRFSLAAERYKTRNAANRYTRHSACRRKQRLKPTRSRNQVQPGRTARTPRQLQQQRR